MLMLLLLIILNTSELKSTVNNSTQDAKGVIVKQNWVNNASSMYFLNAFLLPVIHVQLWAYFDSSFLTQQQKTAPPSIAQAEFGATAVSVTDALMMLGFVAGIFSKLHLRFSSIPSGSTVFSVYNHVEFTFGFKMQVLTLVYCISMSWTNLHLFNVVTMDSSFWESVCMASAQQSVLYRLFVIPLWHRRKQETSDEMPKYLESTFDHWSILAVEICSVHFKFCFL